MEEFEESRVEPFVKEIEHEYIGSLCDLIVYNCFVSFLN